MILGARILLLDPDGRVLLLHSIDPAEPGRRWWDLPGGKSEPGEALVDTVHRELEEETGLGPVPVDRVLWVRESRYRFHGQQWHRSDTVFLGRLGRPTVAAVNERSNLIEARWWSLADIRQSGEWFLPPELPDLFARLLAGDLCEPVRLVYPPS